MNILRNLIWSASSRARQKRAEIFRRKFRLDEKTKILDIGSESGENINLVLNGTKVVPENVYIADIDFVAITKGKEKFGFQPIELIESDTLPFEDNFFDIVYCSSVIEHVGVAKANENVWLINQENDLRENVFEKQKLLAKEIRRVGRQYFVQTPSRRFPIESHTWLPFFAFLPRKAQVKALVWTNKFWIKQAVPDFNLLDRRQMAELFPDAEIVFERKFGLIKSVMAIKSLR